MSATPKNALSNFKRAAGAPAAPTPAPGPVMPAPAPTPAPKEPKPDRIRQTVDLDPDQHRRLRLWALDRRTDGSSIIRALLEELDQDQDLAGRIAARIKEAKAR